MIARRSSDLRADIFWADETSFATQNQARRKAETHVAISASCFITFDI
jgi:hypothetical protein